jgi:adenylate cyclase class 2
MYNEIEAKLKVDSLDEVEARLKELDAEFVEEQFQSDCHYDDAEATLTNNDKCLRLRKQTAGQYSRYFLTFKGAKEQSNFKKRREIDIEIADADSTEKLLTALGYEGTLSVEKTRRLWKFHGCEIALDNLQLLGDYVEIEGPDDEIIVEVQKMLGLESLSHIAKSYASLIVDKLRHQINE